MDRSSHARDRTRVVGCGSSWTLIGHCGNNRAVGGGYMSSSVEPFAVVNLLWVKERTYRKDKAPASASLSFCGTQT